MIKGMAAAAVLLLFAVNSTLAAQPQSVNLVMVGGVVSPGDQGYSERGGQLVSASILGVPVDPKTSVFHLTLQARVSGTTALGSAWFDLKAMAPRGGTVEVNGTIAIDGITPAVLFPLGCTPGVDCTQAIPAFFNGSGTVAIQQGHAVTRLGVNMAFESPYLNPYGGPLLFVSEGGEIVGAATYSQATISWAGVQMGGLVSGTIGGIQVSGQFGMLVSSFEDLKTGIELDRGAIGFSSMSVGAYNSAGSFLGVSKIPKTGGAPCAGFPVGTCFETGLVSSGVFSQSTAAGGTLSGSYSTVWTAPAVGFTSQASGILR